MTTRALVIAECGSCHDGDPAKFKALVCAASECGADIAKFQWTSGPAELAARRHAPELHAAYARHLTWPAPWHAGLELECAQRGLGYMCTVYLPQDVAVVAPHVVHFKVAAFEARAQDLLRAHLPFVDRDGQRDVFVSAGMGERADGGPLPGHLAHRARYLLCTSAYPAPVEALNLCRLHEKDAEYFEGFSDHSAPDMTWTGALAVAAGAEIVERHLRLNDTSPDNPDYPHSMTPRAFADYVRHIRYAEAAMGDGLIQAMQAEEPMLKHRVLVP